MSDHLPDQMWFSDLLNQIAEVAGVRAALLIGRDKACQRIFIPSVERLHAGHWLIELVGDEAAYKIAGRFHGHLDIPPALGGQKRRRRRAITEMTEAGWTIRAISKTLGVARSTVTLNRSKLAKKQKDLFDDE